MIDSNREIKGFSRTSTTNVKYGTNLHKFIIRGISEGIPIRTHMCGELDALPVYKITITLFWDPSRKLNAENEMATQQGANISK